jgi:hypothetical protein
MDSPLKSVTAWCQAFLCYLTEKLENRYPDVLESEKQSTEVGQTILLYRIAGKRGVFEMPAIELCQNDQMLSHFHPLQIRKIVWIACSEKMLHKSES